MKKKESINALTKDERSFRRYILLGIVLILIFLSYRIIEPYIIVLISSFILVYLARPLFNFFKPKFGPGLSAFICLILTLLVLILPTALVITTLANQATSVLEITDLTSVIDKVTSIPILNKINFNWDNAVEKLSEFIFSLVGNILGKIPGLLVSGLIFLFSFFYILVGWSSLTKQIKKFIPFKEKDRITNEINRATHGIIFGYLLVAILDFVVSAIGLYFAGMSYYLLLSFLVAILVFVPGLGPSVVNLPLLVYFALIGNWYSFFIVLATWAFISIVIETFLASKVLSGRSRIHPMIMLLGILGGTTLFGLFGFIIGPLILVYTLRLVKELISKN